MKGFVSMRLLWGFVAFFLVCPRAPAGVEGDVELLRLVAEGYRANREKLVTWKATARETLNYHGTLYGEDYGRRAVERTLEIACDRGLSANRCNTTVTDVRYEKDGAEHQGVAGNTENHLIKDNTLYWFAFFPEAGAGGIRVRQALDANPAPPFDFDVCGWLRRPGVNMHDFCMTYAGWAENPKVTASVEREGDLVTLDVSGGTSRYTFDLSRGGNLVASRYHAENHTFERTIEYEEVNGVFVPKRITLQQDHIREDGLTNFRSLEITVQNEMVNEPLDASEFELRAIGIEPGDTIDDRRSHADTGVKLRYTGDPQSELALELPLGGDVEEVLGLDDILKTSKTALAGTPDTARVEAPSETAPEQSVPAPQEPAGAWGRWLLLFGCGVAIALVLMWALRKYRKT